MSERTATTLIYIGMLLIVLIQFSLLLYALFKESFKNKRRLTKCAPDVVNASAKKSVSRKNRSGKHVGVA